ncbi:MAG TPA: GDSL-type esterase/lipase family protein [Verrucomicrobiae bacterium]|nr:GDSL-type esterase/lipase family protein [Verrucomicrobiae bacterium]
MFRALCARSLLIFPLLLLVSCSSPKLSPLASDAVVLAFGDSITFGTGASPEEAYPVRLEGMIGRRVVNAGVPGETTAEGLARLPEVLEREKPSVMILCLGGNDFLRRIDERETAENLRRLVLAAKERGVPVVLVGVPKLGFFLQTHPLYKELASELQLPYEGKVVQRVLSDNALKSDPVHPNAAGYHEMAKGVAELLRKSGAIPG